MKNETRLYYKKKINDKRKLRFTSVIVKTREDGNWIDSAMTTSKIKAGKLIYQKQTEDS